MGLLSKIKLFVLLLLFVFVQKTNAQYYANLNKPDTNKYIRFGVVPFQLPTRSVGVYFGVNKPSSHWEYRPTYTIPFKDALFIVKNDFFFFQGINNHIILKFNENRNVHSRLLIIQRTWWYNNKYFSVDNITSSRDMVARSHQSCLINGGGIGGDFYWDFSSDHFNGNYFFSTSISYLYGKRKLDDTSNPALGTIKSFDRNMFLVNVSFGIELGYKTY
jgi:hypothetical protein